MKALFAALCLTSAVASAHASEYGCKVLLCLANPPSNGGARAFEECRPPIDQLHFDLAKGRPFPTCGKEDGNDGSSYARQVYDPYDPCPEPLQPAARGSYVVQGQRTARKTHPPISNDGSRAGEFTLTGQPHVSQSSGGEYIASSSMRACVGKSVGSYLVGESDIRVNVFDQVTWQKAQNPRAIDIYIDSKLHQRVRW